jgi:hypothetical protein
VAVPSGGGFAFSSTNDADGALDTYLRRDAANTLAQRNGNEGQTFRLYGRFTDITDNFERFFINAPTTTGAAVLLGTQKGATAGTARALELQTDGTTRLTIASTGDVTVSGAITVTGNFVNFSNRAYISSLGNGILQLRNFSSADFDRLQFGGSTSSFPALKRSTTFLQARLADDSASCGFSAANVQAETAYTVATLPTPATGMIARVTDATLPVIGATVAGGGAAYALVNYNGANWTVIGV